MSEANVVFTLDGENLTIQCSIEDKLKDICQKYSTQIKEKMNSLLFLYRENKVNFELSFKDQANNIDRSNHKIKISVYKYNCPECNEKLEKLDKIISNNDKIEDSINDIKLKIDNIINISSNNPFNIQLKNINNILSTVKEDIKKNNDEIKNLLNNYINTKKISNSIKIISSYRIDKKLLQNIKSIFFSRILFFYLDEKIKLKLIKYNKNLQNIIDIKLINYKFYSGKYIIYENSFKGKEYQGYNDSLIYEGEYLNGERNGKGKEFDEITGYLKFEGEYLNGGRNGKGKEYNYDGKLIFEGEYLSGERNGTGKEYYYNGILKFEGEYLNGEKVTGKLYDKNGNLYCNLKSANGLIKEYDYDGKLIFEGEYLNGKRNIKGKEYNYDGYLEFEGEYLNGKIRR